MNKAIHIAAIALVAASGITSARGDTAGAPRTTRVKFADLDTAGIRGTTVLFAA